MEVVPALPLGQVRAQGSPENQAGCPSFLPSALYPPTAGLRPSLPCLRAPPSCVITIDLHNASWSPSDPPTGHWGSLWSDED